MIKKIGILLLCASFAYGSAHESENKKVCGKDKKSCLSDPKCLCYCSRICELREKKADDKPVYVENDPNGHYCYCKQWDLDNYDRQRCKIKEKKKRRQAH